MKQIIKSLCHHLSFDITKNLPQSHFQNNEPETLNNNLEPLAAQPCIRWLVPPSSSHSNYYHVYREPKEKGKNLGSMVQSLASLVNRNVIKSHWKWEHC